MNRWKIEYHNGLVDIVRSPVLSVENLRLKHNEGIAAITFMQPVQKAEPSPWKAYISA
jgi:hypothetical protein